MKALALVLLLLCSPALAATPRNALLDVSADVLEPGESQIDLFFGQLGMGVLPRVQLSSQVAPYLLTLLNLSAKVQVLDRPELRVSVEGGAYWLAIGRLVDANVLSIPVAVRGTVPLADNLNLHLGAGYHRFAFAFEETATDSNALHVETTLARHDSRGAFLLTAKAPLLNIQHARSQSAIDNRPLEGTLALDGISSWSVMLARDHLFGKTGHVRFGIGYRHRPGILLVESIGPVVVNFNLYWR
ncbi:hypothetical protein F0U62_13285 [Cystobacter fuscus]|uniref:hypothetical protein n=1 Tax=Cystobacter fuscus TaxID=43 RepID=UPI002B2D5829|nr:hypothetical protein F0U62_13285 [Cystobacter fuscus]